MSPDDCTLIIPASGFSVRFGEHDKLLADFNGSPLAAYAAQRAVDAGFAKMIAVVPKYHYARAQIFASRGFQLVENTAPELGQANSIQLGFDAIDKPVKAVCIMLADMPLVPLFHIHALVTAAPENGVIKTLYEGHTQPPAVFTGTAELPQAVKTAADLQLWLENENAELRPALMAKGNRISVNQLFVEKDALIKDGDEIAFMSPLSGG